MGGGGVSDQLLMLSPEMVKYQIPISAGGVGGGGGWSPTFDAKSRNAKNPKFPFLQVGGWVGDQLLMPTPEMLKSQIPISAGGGLGW